MNTTIKKALDMTKPKQHATLKDALVFKLKGLIKVAAFVAVGFLLVHWLVGGQQEIIDGTYDPDRQQSADVMDIREPAKGSPSAVMEKHGHECWTSKQEPKADLPGAAVVQYPSGKTVYVDNSTPKGYKIVDAAFNEALAAVGYGDVTTDAFEVIALCK